MKEKLISTRKSSVDVPQVLNVFFPGKCNLQCRYCFVHKEAENFKDVDEQAIKREIEIFLDYPGKKKVLSFNGGEPLLEWQLIKRIYAYAQKQAQKRGLFLEGVVVTNGTLLKQVHVDFFSKNKISVRLSIDGDKKTHDEARPFKAKNGKSSFEAIMKNLDQLTPQTLEFSVSLVFGPATVSELLNNLKFLQQKGFKYIDFYPEIYATWSKEEIKKFEIVAAEIGKYYVSLFHNKDEQKKLFRISMLDMILNGTNVGKQEVCGKIQVDTLGNFFVCDKVFSLPKKRRAAYSIGNVETGVADKKRQALLSVLRKEFLVETKLGCEGCNLRKYCFCPVGQYLYRKNLKMESPLFWKSFCAVSSILIKMNLDIVKKLQYSDSFIDLNRF